MQVLLICWQVLLAVQIQTPHLTFSAEKSRDLDNLRSFGHSNIRVPNMSGFEIAGVVLGSIPIVVSALEYYVKGLGILQNFHSYKRLLKSLILALKTEHINLQNVCEKLLVGIAPQTCIEMMIREPFGKFWREEGINNKLRLRLWTSLSLFDERVQDMRLAIEEMMEKLNIGPGVEVSDMLLLSLPSRSILFVHANMS
jgi:hypothetical protein